LPWIAEATWVVWRASSAVTVSCEWPYPLVSSPLS
jgi:hypothetical protein